MLIHYLNRHYKLLLFLLILCSPNTVLLASNLLIQAETEASLGEVLTKPSPSIISNASFMPLKNVPTNNLGGWSIDTTNRQRVRQFYNSVFLASKKTDMGWTGNVSACQAGTTSSDFKNSVNARVNYFRAMVGVPAAVTFNASFNQKSQQAALIMSANNTLNHTPPSSWACYSTEGSEAAGSSNLSLGNDGWDAVDAQMRDNGTNNTIAGHRRWIVHPQTQQMGTGDIPEDGSFRRTNSLWVFDDRTFDTRPTTRDDFVAWPTKGYNPYQIVPIRWSFAYPNADFSATTVTMTKNGANIGTVIEDRYSTLGEPAIIWIPDGKSASASSARWEKPNSDTTYIVTVANVMIAGIAQTFTYHVTIFDPNSAVAGEERPIITGNSTPNAGTASTYHFNSVSDAESYDALNAEVAIESTFYNAEDNGNSVTDQTDSSYALISMNNGLSNSAAYALAPASTSESVQITGTFIPSSNATLEFSSKLGFATATQIASIQVSTDSGSSWTDIYTQTGGDTGSVIDSVFVSRSVSLANYANQLINLRINYRYSGLHYIGTNSSVSFLVDNLSFTNTRKVVAETIQSIGSRTRFSITPESNKSYVLAARPVMWTGYPAAEWGALFELSVSTSTDTVITETIPTQRSEVTTNPKEGGSSGYVHYFLLQISTPLTKAVSVDYQTQDPIAPTDDIATVGQDYEFTSGTAIIPIGATHFAIPVRILGDNIPENSESFTMSISNPQGGIFPDGVSTITATHTIIDDD